MEFSTLSEFDNELSKLSKKFRTLKEDIDLLKKVLVVYPRIHPPTCIRISNLGIKTEIYKVKHFRCKSLKKGSRSGIRIIYAYLESEKRIEFAEIYYKDKDDRDCDKKRILKYYN